MKVKLTIIGDKVHDIGYRLFLTMKASELDLKGFSAFNTIIGNRQAVICYIEGKDRQVSSFSNTVRNEWPSLAKVESVKVEEYRGPVMDLMKFLHILQLEQMCKFVNVGLEISEKQGSMLEMQNKMLEGQNKMLERQDEMLKRQDMMLRKQDEMLRKQGMMLRKQDEISKGQDGIINEIKALRLDLRSFLDERFRKIEAEIEKIKAKIGLV